MNPLVMIGCVLIGYISSNFAINVGYTAAAVPKERSAFLSGGARTERVLHDILDEVQTINQRMERIESAMQQNAELSHESVPAEPPSLHQPPVR